jgi:hypothetical protein
MTKCSASLTVRKTLNKATIDIILLLSKTQKINAVEDVPIVGGN